MSIATTMIAADCGIIPSDMQVSQKTAVAVHILVCLMKFRGEYKMTSEFLAESTGVNAVIIRQLLGRLKSASLVTVSAGVGGAELARKPTEISLWDIFEAVEDRDNLFTIHRNPNQQCPVGRVIAKRLESVFTRVRTAFASEMKSIHLSDIKI